MMRRVREKERKRQRRRANRVKMEKWDNQKERMSENHMQRGTRKSEIEGGAADDEIE
jgi:hypothetical protein